MMAAKQWKMAGRQLWFATAFLLLALRLLSPTGFMPQWRADGFRIELCHGIAAAPAHHHGQPAKQQKKAHETCPYAAAAAGGFVVTPQNAAIEGIAHAAERQGWAIAAAAPTDWRHERPRTRAPPPIG
jgi:hypothetical protein